MTLNLRFLLAALVLSSPWLARADDDHEAADVAAIARTWLSEIDAGRFEQSYTDAGSSLHDKVPQDSWIKILTTERPPLGKVVSREVVSHEKHTDGLEGTTGEFMVIHFHTLFSSNADEREVVVLKHDFGGWRCVGYNFGPANPGSSSSDGAAQTTTTDQTLTPPTPTNTVTVPAKRDH